MGLEDERLLAQRNVQRVADAGQAVGKAASFVGLKAFNWLFRPWSIVLIVVLVAAAAWGGTSYLKHSEQLAAEQRARDRMADEFADVIAKAQLGMSDTLSMGLTEVDIRRGRCIFAFKTVSCVYGDFVISEGKLIKQ